VHFIPETSVLLAYLAGVIIITLTPGPDMTFFISRAIGQSVPAGLAAFAGASFGILVHTALVAFGLAALIVASPTFFLALKLFGAIYLAYLAYQALRYGSTFTVSEKKQKSRSLFSNWLQGVGINLLNPKIILFFMTFLPQFISVNDPHATGKLFFLGSLFVVVAIPRPCRTTSVSENSVSRLRTCCAIAACVTFNSRAALLKLFNRAVASNARRDAREGI